MELVSHLARQAAFSRATFGPGARTKGVSDHIEKELKEVAQVYESPNNVSRIQTHSEAAEEWTDVAILALDGLTRSLWAAHPMLTSLQIADLACQMILMKQGENELRDWPDWRQADPAKAIEHNRTEEDTLRKAGETQAEKFGR